MARAREAYSHCCHSPHRGNLHSMSYSRNRHREGVGRLLPPNLAHLHDGVGRLLPPQSRLSVPRDREIHLPQLKPSIEESCPHERQQQNNDPVTSTSCVKETEPEVLEITLSLPESYPSPPMIVVAPPITLIRLPSPPSDFEDECESPKPKKKGKGKKGGPVMSQ